MLLSSCHTFACHLYRLHRQELSGSDSATFSGISLLPFFLFHCPTASSHSLKKVKVSFGLSLPAICPAPKIFNSVRSP